MQLIVRAKQKILWYLANMHAKKVKNSYSINAAVRAKRAKFTILFSQIH